MQVEERVQANELLREEIHRIVHSEEFRSSEVLRRLLLYLAEKEASGEADNLKEYVVAVEGLGKPASYDPQHNSAVRIQVGRLRQKLAEYYRGGGKDDSVIVELPKGRFRLAYEDRRTEPRPSLPVTSPGSAKPPLNQPPATSPRRYALWLSLAAMALAVACAVWFGVRRSPAPSTAAAGWTPELQSLWGTFANSKRPLIILIEDPLFIELHSQPGVYYRDRSLNQWADVQRSDTMREVSKALHSPEIQPSRYYTAFGEVDAAFRLGRFLGPHVMLFSLAKASQVTWQQMSDNNVIFIGVENLFFEQAHGLPIKPQLLPVLQGVSNPLPTPGEPVLFTDQYQTAPTEQGTIYAIVTHLPGPLGSNDVTSFTSNRSAGYVGAVQAFADPKFAKLVVERLKSVSVGRMPHYYQVLLKVRFTDDVPTETSFVLGRELR